MPNLNEQLAEAAAPIAQVKEALYLAADGHADDASWCDSDGAASAHMALARAAADAASALTTAFTAISHYRQLERESRELAAA